MSQMWQPRFDVREAYSFPRGPMDGLQCDSASIGPPTLRAVGTYGVTPTPLEEWPEIFLMTKEEFLAMAARAVRPGANLAGLAMDANHLKKLWVEMGIKGKATVKTINGKDYVILSGNAELRKTLTSTKYGIKNVKIVQMGIGPVGQWKAGSRFAGIKIVFAVGANILEAVLKDQELLTTELGLTIATDVGKGALAWAVDIAISVVVGSMTGLVVAPVAAGIVVGIGFSLLIDQVYPTDQIVSKMQSSIAEAGSKKDEAVRTFHWVNSTTEGAIWFMQGFSGGRIR